jgi:hypothetical protein
MVTVARPLGWKLAHTTSIAQLGLRHRKSTKGLVSVKSPTFIQMHIE